MKSILPLLAAGSLLASCLLFDDRERPNAVMVADVNGLSLTTDDTLVVTRLLTNTGASDLWINATPDAFDMASSSGAPACVDPSLAQRALELVHLPTDSSIILERRYPLSERTNCTVGFYTISLVSHFRRSETGDDSFSLRTPTSGFELTAPVP
jgi:hypothetical protein